MISAQNHTAHCRIILPALRDEVTGYAAGESARFPGEPAERCRKIRAIGERNEM